MSSAEPTGLSIKEEPSPSVEIGLDDAINIKAEEEDFDIDDGDSDYGVEFDMVEEAQDSDSDCDAVVNNSYIIREISGTNGNASQQPPGTSRTTMDNGRKRKFPSTQHYGRAEQAGTRSSDQNADRKQHLICKQSSSISRSTPHQHRVPPTLLSSRSSTPIENPLMQDIYLQLQSINQKLDNQQVVLDMLLAHIGVNTPNPPETSPPPFKTWRFEPVQNASQLRDLCVNLQNDEFKCKFMRMLRQNINMGRCGEDKMLAALDLICSKQFQAECTWTGASRKGPKTAIMSHQAIVDVCMEIGSSATEIINYETVSAFFMKKLKNAMKRTFMSGQRRCSRHSIAKKTKSVTTTEDTVDGQLETNGQTMDEQSNGMSRSPNISESG